jgi:O-methyltransferase involved in polyketide biosynthesis
MENEKISITAVMIAKQRVFSDIPYSRQIFEMLGEAPQDFDSPLIAPQIEARYKLINKMLIESGVNQVLEIASGLSPRGLELTDDKSVNYTEVDLPGIMAKKRKIVERIGDKDNLHLEDGNALDISTLEKATKHFDQSKPIVVINEGLLRYLDFNQKTIVARNIYTLLQQFGGVWITPDITLREVMKAEDNVYKGQNDQISSKIGVNIHENCFENVSEAQKFFEILNFTVEKHNFSEIIDELVSPKKLNQSQEEVKALIDKAWVFVMKIKV